jgi:hypothetical protein
MAELTITVKVSDTDQTVLKNDLLDYLHLMQVLHPLVVQMLMVLH